MRPQYYETSKLRAITRRFELSSFEQEILDQGSRVIQLSISKQSQVQTYDLFAMEVFYNPEIVDIPTGALFGALILAIMYILIIWEVNEKLSNFLACQRD